MPAAWENNAYNTYNSSQVQIDSTIVIDISLLPAVFLRYFSVLALELKTSQCIYRVKSI